MVVSDSAGSMSLREPFDAAARSRRLATRLSAVLPPRPRLIDVTPRSGEMFRWLAPLLARAQVWTLVDPDGAKLDEAFETCGVWAIEAGYRATFPGHSHNRVLLVHTSTGAWRIEAVVSDIVHSNAEALAGADAVVCSDPSVRLRRWLGAQVRAPLLATLIADGRDSFRPRRALDTALRSGDRLAAASFTRTLAARGFAVSSDIADWIVPRPALAMLHAIIDQRAAARRGAAIAAWHRARIRQALAGKLAIRVGHRDILALPPGGK